MKVAEILKSKGTKVVTMRPGSTIDTVVHRMRLERIGAVIRPACGRSNSPWRRSSGTTTTGDSSASTA